MNVKKFMRNNSYGIMQEIYTVLSHVVFAYGLLTIISTKNP